MENDDDRPALLFLAGLILTVLAALSDWADTATTAGPPLYALGFGWLAVALLAVGAGAVAVHAMGGPWWVLAIGLAVYAGGLGLGYYLAGGYVSQNLMEASIGLFLGVAGLFAFTLSAIHNVRVFSKRSRGAAA